VSEPTNAVQQHVASAHPDVVRPGKPANSHDTAAAHPLADLQRALGNSGVLQRLAGPTVQPKLEVGAPDDRSEREADAIAAADQYIQLHPGSHEIAYAFYLKAMSLYEQITDVGRDQSNTEQALTALQDVVQRFPNTEYARDASLKIDLTLDHLAGKEMAVGRYYLVRGDYIGAINRFRTVVERYQKTSQIAEALERLTEAYYALGVYDEAKTAAAVLGANYPGSMWYKDSYELLVTHNMKPVANKGSWISRAFASPL